MMRPRSNGLVELHEDGGNERARGKFCLRLMGYVGEEAEMGTEEYRLLYEQREAEMAAGSCHYRDRCPVYERTIEKRRKEGVQTRIEFEF